MLTNNLTKKLCMFGFCMGIFASPLAIANNSIELNQDRTAGHDVIAKPQSQAAPGVASYTKNDLIYDKGDRQPHQRFIIKSTRKSVDKANFVPADLVGQGN
ncbi:hypothetical protein FRY77_06315 [Halomonas sp. MG34]|nr:hypothetical protein [Halomonas sp. MG34]